VVIENRFNDLNINHCQILRNIITEQVHHTSPLQNMTFAQFFNHKIFSFAIE